MLGNKKGKEIQLWKILTNFWGILAGLAYLLTFFGIFDVGASLSSISVIYISILSIFAGVKEISRWRNKDFASRYHGEIFIIAWTILIVIFLVLAAMFPDKYNMAGQFTATYLSVIGIFAISRKSKNLRLK